MSKHRAYVFAAVLGSMLALGCGAENRQASALSSQLSSEEVVTPEVDRLFSRFDQRSPGAAVLVLEKGKVIHRKGYGLRDVDQNAVATSDSSFRLASVSKQFIGMAIAILTEQGKLTYEQTLTDFFPGFPAYGGRITVSHLLHHVSGLRDYENLIPSGRSTQLSDRDVLDLYVKSTTGTSFSPGSRYRYCNGGYVLLGLIVEAASGQNLGAFLGEHIFQPLGMKAVMYEGEATPIAERAFGYSWRGGWVKTDQSVTSATRGDGGVYASVADFEHWEKALSSPVLVSADTLAKIFSPYQLSSGASSGYGFGWEIASYQGLRRVSHTGSTIGFRSVIQRFPDKELTIVVVINREGSEPWTYASRIADALLF